MKELIFYRCGICGNLMCAVYSSGVTPRCCGQEMECVRPNTVDVGAEKHMPVIRTADNAVHISVGSMPHPMTEEHFIEWIILQTNRGTYARRLMPDRSPKVCFRIQADEYPLRAYAWCNLHGLWMQNISE